MRRYTAAAGILLCMAGTPAGAAEPSEDAVVRGKYVFDAAGCAACHTDEANDGPLLGGGRKLDTPFGVFYSPNITADAEHGIGGWSDADFIRALRHGESPDGSNFFPVFPYPSYTAMTEDDMRDLKAYIFSLPTADRANTPHEVSPPFNWRFLVTFWKWMFFEPGQFEADPAKDDAWNRGAYLATALGHCGECHTPRNMFGATDGDMKLAGAAEGPEGGAVPNITPHPETGIGDWSADDLDTMFTLGMLPDGDFVGGGMADVVNNGTSRLSAEDRRALIEYLRSLPPIDNTVEQSVP